MAGKQEHRALRGERREQGRGGVGLALAAGDQGDADLAGEAPQASAMCTQAASWRTCTTAMPVDSSASKDRHDVVARQGEDAADAQALQGLDDDVGSARLAHGVPPVGSVVRGRRFRPPRRAGNRPDAHA